MGEGDNRNIERPNPTPARMILKLSPVSFLFSVCIMSYLEKQKLGNELRKFRKKLRQIEKLEELERELTEEEYLKVTLEVKTS